MDSCELAARFSLQPNLRGYCGEPGLLPAFERFMAGKSGADGARLRAQLEKLPLMCAYLETIADANGIDDKFDSSVVEGFWIGNKTIEKVSATDMENLYSKKMVEKGIYSKKRGNAIVAKINSLEKIPPLHHSFHVYMAEFASPRAEKSARNKDLCRPSWGRVLEAGGDETTVERKPVELKLGKFAFGKLKKAKLQRTIGKTALVSRDAKLVASHWSVAVAEITGLQAKTMDKCVEAVLGCIA